MGSSGEPKEEMPELIFARLVGVNETEMNGRVLQEEGTAHELKAAKRLVFQE